MVELRSQVPVLMYDRMQRLRVRRPSPDVPLGIWLDVDHRPEARRVTVARAGDMYDTLVWGEAGTLYLGYRTRYIPGEGDIMYDQVLEADKRIVLHEPDIGTRGTLCVVAPVGLLYAVVDR